MREWRPPRRLLTPGCAPASGCSTSPRRCYRRRSRLRWRCSAWPLTTAKESGQLTIASAETGFLRRGRFEPRRVIDALGREIEASERAGYQGLRLVGDMAWALRSEPGVEQLPWFEAQVNHLFGNGRLTAICQYDRRLFSARQLRRAASAHAGAIDATSPAGWWLPRLRFTRTGQPPVLRLFGEADVSNRHALAAVLAHHAETAPGVAEIDASALVFVDGTAANLFVLAAQASPNGVRVTCREQFARVLAAVGADEVTALTVTKVGAHDDD